jgi:hypothetical protein
MAWRRAGDLHQTAGEERIVVEAPRMQSEACCTFTTPLRSALCRRLNEMFALRYAAGYALAVVESISRTLQAFHRSIANTVVYTALADKRIRNIWGK